MVQKKSARFTMSLPPGDHDRLQAVASAAQLKLTYVIQLAVRSYLEQVKKDGRVVIDVSGVDKRN